jgi:Uma2 family endonuclease
MPLTAPVSTPLLLEGDSLTSDEFLRRWEKMPDLKHAELIAEVAVSSYSRDFGAKRRMYERMGVREYIVAAPRDQKLVSLSLTSSGFQPLEADDDGILRSAYFPGLWLDTKSLWDLDLQRMNSVLQQGLATPEHAAFAEKLASQKR